VKLFVIKKLSFNEDNLIVTEDVLAKVACYLEILLHSLLFCIVMIAA